MVQPGVLGGTRFLVRCVVLSLPRPYALLPSHLSSNLLTYVSRHFAERDMCLNAKCPSVCGGLLRTHPEAGHKL